MNQEERGAPSTAQLQDELARCRARLAERDDENRALRRGDEQLKEKLRGTHAELEHHRAKGNEHHALGGRLHSTLAATAAMLEAREERINARIVEMREELEAEQRTRAAIEQRERASALKCESLEAELSEMSRRAEAEQRARAAVEQRERASAIKCESLEAELIEMSRRAEAQLKDGAASSLEAELRERARNRAALEAQIASRARVGTSELESDCAAELQAVKRQLAQAQLALQCQRERGASKADAARELAAQNDELERELKSARRRAAAREDENAELERKLKASEVERARLKGVQSALGESERRREEEREAWTNRLAELSAVLTEQQLDSQRKTNETERLSTELSSVTQLHAVCELRLARSLSEARARKRLAHDRLQLEHELRVELGAVSGGPKDGLGSAPVRDRPETPTSSGSRFAPGIANDPRQATEREDTRREGRSPAAAASGELRFADLRAD